MYTDQIQRWADNAAYAAGKAYNQGKDVLSSARDKAYDAAVRAANARKARLKEAQYQAEGYLPRIHKGWNSLVDNVGDGVSRFGDHVHGRFHNTERMLLKVGGVFLLFKCFSHRHEPVSEIAQEVRARVEERPIESAIIALGIGYALGKLLR